MNYIEEELRRQAAAFAALLGGGPGRVENTAEKIGDCERTQAEEGGGDGVLRVCPAAQMLRRDPTGKMAEWNQTLRRRSAQSFRQAANALGLTQTELEETMAERNQAERTEPEWMGSRRVNRDEDRAAAERMKACGGGDTIRRVRKTAGDGDQKINFRDCMETILVLNESVSAGELSRVFQRDARRYDGGYPLY